MVYMFHAICQFMQFQKCTVLFRNSRTTNLFIYCAKHHAIVNSYLPWSKSYFTAFANRTKEQVRPRKASESAKTWLATVPVNKTFTFDDHRTIVLRCEHFRGTAFSHRFSSVPSFFRSVFVPFSFHSACEPVSPM